MAYRKITKEGERFLQHIANTNGEKGLISGKNKYEIPFTYDIEIPNTLNANIIYKDYLIENNEQYIDFLIYYYNHYGEIYDLDANILIAQAYVESNLKCWNYAPYNSTATGISQFLIGSLYEVIITNGYNVEPKFNMSEINRLIANVEDPFSKDSYMVGSGRVLDEKSSLFDNYAKARKNRFHILINAMNNPDLLIKAQFRYMKHIANRNKHIAANTLFAYNRGSSYRGKDYYDIVNKVKSRRGSEYIKEGINYVERIFGILGDRNNVNIKNKPKYYYFGYNLNLDKNNFNEMKLNA